ncbi:hypothetical protein [Aliarcobacter cryaerophilus]|uniref:hypothetical protein n=1 Tax=Aliarcobacter cryaerophilus TaxID=28198 RepID=UPI0021CCD223|nr:hypothetical protein [Aliarcobacter cryaerophilus]
MSQDFLYLISKEQLHKEFIFENIYPNKNINYYLCDDLSLKTYIKLCKFGFISTSIILENNFYLLPEIQFEYAILDFNNLHISKKVKTLLKNNEYKFCINRDFKAVLNQIKNYHKDSWIEENYEKLLINLNNLKNNNSNFKLVSIELYDKNNEKLVSGEIGYIISKTYTSLTGFSSKSKVYNNWGKLQMVLLALYLEENRFDFWNLGHPYMQYKFDLGAKLYSRDEFLKRWLYSI